jgi:DNA-binding transcriptional MerR regulator
VRELDINEVAKQTGLPASALRFYEEKGLIASVGRRGLRRIFDGGVVERLALIALGTSAGLSLAEIARMLVHAVGARDHRPKIDRQVLAAKADELDANIRKLTAMRDGLRHAAVCSAPSHMECPTFRRLLGITKLRNVRAQRGSFPKRKTFVPAPTSKSSNAKLPASKTQWRVK